MNKKIIFLSLIILVLAGGIWFLTKSKIKSGSGEIIHEVSPVVGSIQKLISTTGSVLPKNRLEIKPPVNGRVENILVAEGDIVKTGQILAWMSSTERAALLDAARGQSEEKLKYWQEAYKAIALIAPIDAEVIVATTQPGQTVTTTDAVIVLSDNLIIRAQVDETDIGKITLGQKAIVSLDAYPQVKIDAVVEHLYYESETVNNVTIYKVDLKPDKVPQFFRSGMNATVDFISETREDVLIIPLEAVIREKDQAYCLVSKGISGQAKQQVKLGLADERNIEVLSGLTAADKIIIKGQKYSHPKGDTGTNPFTPFRRRQ